MKDGVLTPKWEMLYCLRCALWGEPWQRIMGDRLKKRGASYEEEDLGESST